MRTLKYLQHGTRGANADECFSLQPDIAGTITGPDCLGCLFPPRTGVDLYDLAISGANRLLGPFADLATMTGSRSPTAIWPVIALKATVIIQSALIGNVVAGLCHRISGTSQNNRRNT